MARKQRMYNVLVGIEKTDGSARYERGAVASLAEYPEEVLENWLEIGVIEEAQHAAVSEPVEEVVPRSRRHG